MAKKKKRKKKIFLPSFSFFLLIISTFLYLCSALMLRTYNNSLSSKWQSIEAEIAEIERSNDAIKIEIQTLTSRERINNIADENRMRLNPKNIITIVPVEKNQ